MKKLLETLPSDWIYRLVSLALITSSTYYLFRFADKIEIVQDLWQIDEKYLISTFLIMQFIVKAFFYWVLFLGLKKFLFGRIKKSVLKVIYEPRTREDLKFISEIKQSLVSLFGVPINLGLIEQQDLESGIKLNEEELGGIMESIVKWICVLIHTSVTSIIVFELSAFYILPLFILIFIIITGYWYGITLIFGNITIIEKARKELLAVSFIEKNSKKINLIN